MKRENSIIKKSNNLVNAHYKLNINEQKILYKVISQIHVNDKNFKDYEIRTSDLIEFIGTRSNTIYQDIKQWTLNLFHQALVIESEERTIQTNWFSAIQHIGKNKILFSFHPVLKPYLLNLKESFTRFDIENVRNFRSKYSPRLYELLKQYEKVGQRIISIEELRKTLSLGSLYKKYNDFKKDVLLKIQEEINNNSDICFDFVEVKEDRKVVAIAFYIRSRKISEPDYIDLPIEKKQEKEESSQICVVDISNNKVSVLKEEIKKVINDEIKESKIIEWIKQEKEERINFYLDNWSKWDYKTKATKAGFFIDLVDNNRPIPSGEKGIRANLEQPIQATNYEQRKYDEEYFDSCYDNFTADEIKAMRESKKI